MSPTWETSTDWDNSQETINTAHENTANTSYSDSTIVRQGPSIETGYLESNLVQRFPLHGNAVDFGSNNDDGSVTGANSVSGPLDTTCLDFDGNDDKVDGFSPPINFYQEDWTISLWINFQSFPANGFLYCATSNDNYINTQVNNNGNQYITYFDGEDSFNNVYSVNTNQWYHIAFVTYWNSQSEIWIDGTRESTSNHSGGTYTSFNWGEAIANREGQDKPTDAKVWDVRVYDKALSSSEINSINNILNGSLGDNYVTTSGKSL